MATELNKIAIVLSLTENSFHSKENKLPEFWKTFSECLQEFSEEKRLTLFMPGYILETWFRYRPGDINWLKEKIRENRLEFLGGTYDDVLIPFFPQKILDLELQKNQELFENRFALSPAGYFNSSLAWEIGMVSFLAKANFAYTLVYDTDIAKSIGRTTKISGWYSTENNGYFLRLLPIDKELSETLLKKDKEKYSELLESRKNNKIWIVKQNLSIDNVENIKNCFTTLKEFHHADSLKTWTLSHIIEQQNSEGKVNLLSALGNSLGLPEASGSCREILLKKKEIYFLHKALLFILRRAERTLTEEEYKSIASGCLEILHPKFYTDKGNFEGIRTPELRFLAHKKILKASNAIENFTEKVPLLAEVTDFLLEGEQQIWIENEWISFLIDKRNGGVLRSLNSKEACVNLLTAFRDDGDISIAFAEHILNPNFSNALALHNIIESRSKALLNPYDYKLERSEKELAIKMNSEQILSVDEKTFIFHLEKNWKISNSDASVKLEYNLTNMMFQDFSGYFGSELEIGSPVIDSKNAIVKLDGKKPDLNTEEPILFPDVQEFLFENQRERISFSLHFSEQISILISPIIGSDKLASPNVHQGYRLFFFKAIHVNSMKSVPFSLKIKLNKTRQLL